LNPDIDDPSLAPTHAAENPSETANYLPFTSQFTSTNFTPKKASASTEPRTNPEEYIYIMKPPHAME
jgi:hypothetical protein